MTDLKGSEGPRNTLMYRKFLQYGPYFAQGSIPTDSHFSPHLSTIPFQTSPVVNIRSKWEY